MPNFIKIGDNEVLVRFGNDPELLLGTSPSSVFGSIKDGCEPPNRCASKANLHYITTNETLGVKKVEYK